MRRVIATVAGTVVGLVMLLSFKTHPSVAAAAPPSAVSTPTGTSTAESAALTDATSTSSTDSSGTKTVTGDSVDTQWGPVQVQITVTNGKLTAATAVVYPTTNPRDQELNSVAIPTLEAETVKAGNANIQMVSGATFTSTGYIASLQSALDKAGLS